MMLIKKKQIKRRYHFNHQSSVLSVEIREQYRNAFFLLLTIYQVLQASYQECLQPTTIDLLKGMILKDQRNRNIDHKKLKML